MNTTAINENRMLDILSRPGSICGERSLMFCADDFMSKQDKLGISIFEAAKNRELWREERMAVQEGTADAGINRGHKILE